MIIETSIGPMDDALLVYSAGETDSENERVSFQEYRFNGEVVKRDAQVHMKQWPAGMAGMGIFG